LHSLSYHPINRYHHSFPTRRSSDLLIVIWSGIGIWSKVVVVFLGAVIPILVNTQTGVKASEARFIRVSRSFSASRLKIFSSIILDRKSTRLNSSHVKISYAVFCLKK